MFRQKPVTEKTLQKYCGFLGAVQRTSLPFHGEDTLIDIAKLHHINPATGKAIADLGIIERLTPTSWKWKAGKKDVTIIAFEVLNKNLFKHKKQIHVPIPEFAAIGEALSTVADRLALISMQNEKLLKSAKTGQIEITGVEDLFHVEDQRLFIAGSIAAGVYKSANICNHRMVVVPDGIALNYPTTADIPAKAQCSLCGYTPDMGEEVYNYSANNDYIVKATDDLMNKLLKRNHKETGRLIIEEPKPHKLIGVCSVCMEEIYSDEPHCKLDDAELKVEAMYCKNHLPKLNGI